MARTKKAPSTRTAQHPARSSTLNDRTLSAAFAYFRQNPKARTVSHGAIRKHFLRQERKHPGVQKYRYNVAKVKTAKAHLEEEEVLVKVGHQLALGDGVKNGIKALRIKEGNDSSDDELAATAFLTARHRGELTSAPKKSKPRAGSTKPRASTSTAKTKPAPAKKRARSSAPLTATDSDSDAPVIVRAPKKPRQSQPAKKDKGKGKAVSKPDDNDSDVSDVDQLAESETDVAPTVALNLLTKAQLKQRAQDAEALVERMREEKIEQAGEKEGLERDLVKLAAAYRKLQTQVRADEIVDEEEQVEERAHFDWQDNPAPAGVEDGQSLHGDLANAADNDDASSLGGFDEFNHTSNFGYVDDSGYYDRSGSVAPTEIDQSAAIDFEATPSSRRKLQPTQSKHHLADQPSQTNHSWNSIHPPSPATSRGGSPILPDPASSSSAPQNQLHSEHVNSLERRHSQLPSPDLSSSPIKAPVAPNEAEDGDLADTVLEFGSAGDDAQTHELYRLKDQNERLMNEVETLKIQVGDLDLQLRKGDKSLELARSEMDDIVCHFQNLADATSADATLSASTLLSLRHRLASTSAALKAAQTPAAPRLTTTPSASTLPVPLSANMPTSTSPPSQTSLPPMTDPPPKFVSLATSTDFQIAPTPSYHTVTSIQPSMIDFATETGDDPDLVNARQDLVASQERLQSAIKRLESTKSEMKSLVDAGLEREKNQVRTIEGLKGELRGLESRNAELEKDREGEAAAIKAGESQLAAEIERSANLLHELDSSSSLYQQLASDSSAHEDTNDHLATLLIRAKTHGELLALVLGKNRETQARDADEKDALVATTSRLQGELQAEVEKVNSLQLQLTEATSAHDQLKVNSEGTISTLEQELADSKARISLVSTELTSKVAWHDALHASLLQLLASLSLPTPPSPSSALSLVTLLSSHISDLSSTVTSTNSTLTSVLDRVQSLILSLKLEPTPATLDEGLSTIEAYIADEIKEHSSFVDEHTEFANDVRGAVAGILKALGRPEVDPAIENGGQLVEVTRIVEGWAAAKETELREMSAALEIEKSDAVEVVGELRRFSSLPFFKKRQSIG